MGQRDLLRNLFPCLPDEESLRLEDGEIHLLEGHEAGDLPELVEEPGAETHVLRRKVPSSARRVDVDDGISITVRRGGVAVGQCRGGCREEETAAAMDVAARERDSKAGGAEEQARAEEEEVPKRRRRRQRRHRFDSTADWSSSKQQVGEGRGWCSGDNAMRFTFGPRGRATPG